MSHSGLTLVGRRQTKARRCGRHTTCNLIRSARGFQTVVRTRLKDARSYFQYLRARGCLLGQLLLNCCGCCFLVCCARRESESDRPQRARARACRTASGCRLRPSAHSGCSLPDDAPFCCECTPFFEMHVEMPLPAGFSVTGAFSWDRVRGARVPRERRSPRATAFQEGAAGLQKGKSVKVYTPSGLDIRCHACQRFHAQ